MREAVVEKTDRTTMNEDMRKAVATPAVGLYLCTRTSAIGEKPCEEAFIVQIVDVDRWRVDDPKKVPCHGGKDGWWYEKGTNHRVDKGMICRDLGVKDMWAVIIFDMQEFVDRHVGVCVVGRDDEGFCTVEIYDDYREGRVQASPKNGSGR